MLGELRSTHPVANGRRWMVGLGALAIAAAASAGLTWLIGNPFASSRFGAALAYAMIPIAVALPIAGTQLWKAVRMDETFELYDRGFAHTVFGKRRTWALDEVAFVDARENDRSPRFGWDFRCTVYLRTGNRLAFNGLTHDARRLAAVLSENRRPAYVRTWAERMVTVAAWLSPVALAGFGYLLWWGATTIMTNDDQTRSTSPDYVEGVEQFSDSTLAGIAALMILGLVGFVMSLIMTLSVTVQHVRGR